MSNGKGLLIVLGTIFAVMIVSFAIPLRYSQAVLVFGLVALALSAFVLPRFENANWALAALAGLTFFASFPFKKLFQLDGFGAETTVSAVYGIILFIVARGWRWRFT